MTATLHPNAVTVADADVDAVADAVAVAPAVVRDAAATDAWLERARHTGFLALVGLIERLQPHAAHVGETGPTELEPLRFHHDPSLAFSAADVAGVRAEDAPALDTAEGGAGKRYRVTTAFLGLSGGVSPLPDYFCDELAVEDADAPVRARFFDLFHHRLLSLLYRGLARLDYPADFELGGRDPWSRRVLALLGADALGSDGTPAETARLLRLAPLLVGRGRGVHVLRAAVEDDLGPDLGPDAQVAIRELLGAWIELEPADRARLSRPTMRLGRTAILGRRIFDRTARFRVVLGPVTYEAMRRLLPGGDLHTRLHTVVKLVTARTEECEAEIIVSAGEAPALRLSRNARQGLGRDSWLGRRAGEQKRVVVPLGG
jgi:type VI secretion system protein ImpH